MDALKFAGSVLFLSTLSARRATGLSYFYIIKITYFYPRSPQGERQSIGTFLTVSVKISIHALRKESDKVEYTSTDLHIIISIHALRKESDSNVIDSNCNFSQKFLSTLSARRATAKVHKTVGHFCAYETNFMEIASSC